MFSTGGSLAVELRGCFFFVKGGSQLKRGKLTFFGGDSSKFKITETGGLGIDMKAHLSTTRKRPCKKKCFGAINSKKQTYLVCFRRLTVSEEGKPSDGRWELVLSYRDLFVYILIY